MIAGIKPVGPLAIAAAMASSASAREVINTAPGWSRSVYLPPARPIVRGIPTAKRPNQRQRRKLHRQTRPHGWKGGAQ